MLNITYVPQIYQHFDYTLNQSLDKIPNYISLQYNHVKDYSALTATAQYNCISKGKISIVINQDTLNTPRGDRVSGLRRKMSQGRGSLRLTSNRDIPTRGESQGVCYHYWVRKMGVSPPTPFSTPDSPQVSLD